MEIKHIVYKTTNLINNKIYVGIHSTINENDNYLGSGRVFLKAVRKHNKINFKKEILHTYKTREDALNKEKEIVNDIFILDENNYNCTIGGYGGIGVSNKGRKHTKEAILKIKEAGKRECKDETKKRIGNANRGRKMSAEVVINNSLALKKYYETNNSPRLGVKLSEETKKKMSENKIGVLWDRENRKIPIAKVVINKIDGTKYKSIKDVVKTLKIPSSTLYRNIKNKNYFLRYE